MHLPFFMSHVFGDLNRMNEATLFDLAALSNGNRTQNEATIRARCQTVFLGDNEVLCRCLGRYKMFLDTRDAGFAPHIMLDGYWEYWITAFIASLVKPGMVVMDVGANFGYYSLLMADLVGPSGSCITLEPNPAVAENLTRTLSINGFAITAPVIRKAVTHSEGSGLSFYVPHTEPKNARLVQTGLSSDGSGDVITVAGTSVDILSANLPRLDFIKVDAEGAEDGIVAGMKKTLDRHKPSLLIEFNAGRGGDAKTMLDTLFAYGHEMQYIDYDAKAKSVTRERLMTEHVGEDWMLFVTPQR